MEGNTGRFISRQKVGGNAMITKEFVRKVKNFMNNFEVSGGSFHFDGVRARLRVDGGTAVAAVAPHPWKVTRADEGATLKVAMHPGSINGIVPSDIFTNETITGSGEEFVVVTLTFTGSDPVPSTATWAVESTHPAMSGTTPDTPPSTVKVVVAMLVDGIIYQVEDDNLNAVSTLVFSEQTWDGAIEQLVDTNYYRWEV